MKEKLDMSPIGNSQTAFYNNHYVIEDLHLNNVKQGLDGNLYFIDSVISLNEAEDDLGGNRAYEYFDVYRDNVAGELGDIRMRLSNMDQTKIPSGYDSLYIVKDKLLVLFNSSKMRLLKNTNRIDARDIIPPLFDRELTDELNREC
jgi:hypothetical protein